jgi:hypothetical protein
MAEEARSILDSLMGGDRNAPLPPGTSVPRRKRSATGPLLLPAKRSKSCYDPDVDPLYCAWGIDVYELFVNTKSDLGANPNSPDDVARREYVKLPKHEQERLGFDFSVWQKLQDLVRQCDRAVSRNKEKLEQEIQRNAQAKGKSDYVEDIDDLAINQLAQCQLLINAVEKELLMILETMEGHVQNQQDLEEKLQEMKMKLQEMETKAAAEEIVKTEDAVEVKEEDDVAVKKEEGTEEATAPTEEEEDTADVKMEEDADDKEKPKDDAQVALELLKIDIEQVTKELHDVVLKKQRSLFDLARKLQQYAPLSESAEQQRKHLHFVKSDITMDKTVCEVSGNFMSARDADERIAAHYAGKQYVGWKLVRDKFKEMQQQYGRYGPPRPQPQRRDGGGGRPDDRYNTQNRGGGRPDDRYANNNNRGPPPLPPRGNYGGGGRDYDNRGGGGRDRGGPPGGAYGRGGGGGGHDRDRRDNGRDRYGR